jgi:hypothetical protein
VRIPKMFEHCFVEQHSPGILPPNFTQTKLQHLGGADQLDSRVDSPQSTVDPRSRSVPSCKEIISIT